MSIPDSSSSSLINWNAESAILAPQPTQFIDLLNLPLHANFAPGSAQSSAIGPGQQEYLNAVSGGRPHHHLHEQFPPPQANGDSQWGPPGTTYHPPHAIGGMPILRTSSHHSLGGHDGHDHGDGLQLYDSTGKFMLQKSPMELHGQDFHQAPPVGVTVVPGEYLSRPAEIAPDEVFYMDREPEYVTSY
ncbi:hypothetical protein FA13DRAFT_1732851 [Coprinellus micaceus]|uniref:Uncharacterized protein n=1 Tax=Coprinellus micaceus TaxID=71717 RepID=A0A4Y7TBA6_COPMI|nr:hypothetical protein FA13DRAFT_1732851 [Coprinellus micaceus]